MSVPGLVSLVLASGLLLMACSSSGTIGNGETTPVSDAEMVFQKGHEFFQQGEFDSAVCYLEQSRSLPRTELVSLRDLSEIRYILAYRVPDSSGAIRNQELRRALDCYQRMESLGDERAEVYERLTEISFELDEKDAFLHFSGKYAEKFPGDRQMYNLGLAYSMVGDNQHVIVTQKAAIERYGLSPYMVGFHRLLGDAYLNAKRQQSAERTYETGVEIAENRLAEYTGASSGSRTDPGYLQLTENRRAMLLSLLKIYRIHGKEEEAGKVEKKLKSEVY